MKAVIDEHISSFKEFLVEDKALQEVTSFNAWDDPSFGEKARELGASLTHKAFDEITDLVKVVPHLSKLAPLKNYPKLISEINKIVFDEFKYFFSNLSMQDF